MIRMMAITGSPDDIHVVTAGGPAGGFIHYMLPYGGAVLTKEVTTIGAFVSPGN